MTIIMNKTIVTPKSYFRLLNILFAALLIGQILFAAIAVFVNYTQPIASPFTPELQQLFLIIVPVVAVVNIAISYFIFTVKIKAIRNETEWRRRLESYQAALIMRYALMEMPSLLAIVIFMLTGNYLFLGVMAAMVLLLLYIKPSANAMVHHLQLHYNDVATLQESDTVLYEKEWAIN